MAYLTKRIDEIVKSRQDTLDAIERLKKYANYFLGNRDVCQSLQLDDTDYNIVFALNSAITELDDYAELLKGIMSETHVYWPPTCIENTERQRLCK